MSRIITPTMWTSQPQYPVGINIANPITRGLVAAYPLSANARDSAGSRNAIVVSGTSNIATKYGVATKFNGTSDYIQLPTTDMISAGSLVVSCWFEKILSPPEEVIFSFNGSSYNSIAGFYQSFLIFGNNNWQYGIPIANVLVGWNHLVYSRSTNTIFLNGVVPATSAANYFTSPPVGNHSIGNRLNGPSPRYFNGGIRDVLIFNRELALNEARSLYENPFQVYAPQPRRIWVPVSGSGGDITLGISGSSISNSTYSLASMRNLYPTGNTIGYIIDSTSPSNTQQTIGNNTVSDIGSTSPSNTQQTIGNNTVSDIGSTSPSNTQQTIGNSTVSDIGSTYPSNTQQTIGNTITNSTGTISILSIVSTTANSILYNVGSITYSSAQSITVGITGSTQLNNIGNLNSSILSSLTGTLGISTINSIIPNLQLQSSGITINNNLGVLGSKIQAIQLSGEGSVAIVGTINTSVIKSILGNNISISIDSMSVETSPLPIIGNSTSSITGVLLSTYTIKIPSLEPIQNSINNITKTITMQVFGNSNTDTTGTLLVISGNIDLNQIYSTTDISYIQIANEDIFVLEKDSIGSIIINTINDYIVP